MLAIVSQQGPLPAPVPLIHDIATESVTSDADDPAIWHHPTDPMKSRIIGTDKIASVGGLFVFDTEGKIVQHIEPLDRPNNVDVEQNVKFGAETWDLAVAAERGKRRLAIYRIDRQTGVLSDATGSTNVFIDRSGSARQPMGISLYHRKTDGALIAVVSAKSGPSEAYLETYRLTMNIEGKIDATKIGAFGKFSGSKEIEAVFCDDENLSVYYADEDSGIHQYAFDGQSPLLKHTAFFGTEDFVGDREGIARIGQSILCVEQLEGKSRIHIFDRSNPIAATKRVLTTDADSTDGIEATDKPFGKFKNGVVVMMNSKDKNFFVYDRSKFVP